MDDNSKKNKHSFETYTVILKNKIKWCLFTICFTNFTFGWYHLIGGGGGVGCEDFMIMTMVTLIFFFTACLNQNIPDIADCILCSSISISILVRSTVQFKSRIGEASWCRDNSTESNLNELTISIYSYNLFIWSLFEKVECSHCYIIYELWNQTDIKCTSVFFWDQLVQSMNGWIAAQRFHVQPRAVQITIHTSECSGYHCPVKLRRALLCYTVNQSFYLMLPLFLCFVVSDSNITRWLARVSCDYF